MARQVHKQRRLGEVLRNLPHNVVLPLLQAQRPRGVQVLRVHKVPAAYASPQNQVDLGLAKVNLGLALVDLGLALVTLGLALVTLGLALANSGLA